MKYNKGWVDCDLKPTIRKYNIASKHHQSIQCQKLDRHYHRCDCNLHKEPSNTQIVMTTRKSSLPEDRKVASRDSLIYKGGEREKKGLFLSDLDLGLKESYWTLRLRDTTNLYSSAEGRKLTNSSHRDLLILYNILSCAYNTGTLNLDVYVIHNLTNKHNNGCKHHSLSWTTLKTGLASKRRWWRCSNRLGDQTQSRGETLQKRSRWHSNPQLGGGIFPRGGTITNLEKGEKYDPSSYPLDEVDSWNIKIVNKRGVSCPSTRELEQRKEGVYPSHGGRGQDRQPWEHGE